MAVSKEEFKKALACFPSGVTVVTTVDSKGVPHGLTVSAFCSVSLDPPLVLICIENETRSQPAFERAGKFVVNILAREQADVSRHFASPRDERFAGIEYRTNQHAIPILNGAVAAIECSVKSSCDGGDHTIFVGLVESAETRNGTPLVYSGGEYRSMS